MEEGEEEEEEEDVEVVIEDEDLEDLNNANADPEVEAAIIEMGHLCKVPPSMTLGPIADSAPDDNDDDEAEEWEGIPDKETEEWEGIQVEVEIEQHNRSMINPGE